MAEWFLFLPQVRLSIGDIVERAQRPRVGHFVLCDGFRHPVVKAA